MHVVLNNFFPLTYLQSFRKKPPQKTQQHPYKVGAVKPTLEPSYRSNQPLDYSQCEVMNILNSRKSLCTSSLKYTIVKKWSYTAVFAPFLVLGLSI